MKVSKIARMYIQGDATEARKKMAELDKHDLALFFYVAGTMYPLTVWSEVVLESLLINTREGLEK